MYMSLFLITYILSSISCSKVDINNAILKEFSVQSTYIPDVQLKRHSWDSSKCYHLKLKILKENYNLCLNIHTLSYPDLINEKTQILTLLTNISVNVTNLLLKTVGGYVLNYENSSFIKGYLHDNRFYGKVQIISDIYYVEPVKNFNLHGANSKPDDSIIYKKPNSSLFDEVNGNFTFKFDVFDINIEADFGRPYKINGKICPLMVAMDNSFIQTIGNGSVDHSIQRLLLNLDEVNAILRSSDFDNDRVPDNVGIWIDLVVALHSRNPKLGSISETPVDEPVDPLQILQKFAMVRFLRPFCLNMLLVGHPFIKQFLGVSFTATKNIFDRFKHVGICGSNSIFIPSLNSLVVTYRFANGEMLPKPLVDVNLVHEIAHSFGSNHDYGECLKGFIMSPRTAIPTTLMNFEFSECSKRDISSVLRKQGDCLLDTKTPYCGNGILEDGEECDCGSSYHCLWKDPCCQARDSPNQCKINKDSYECHPSEDLCCDNKCIYKDLSKFGLDCTKFQKKCPCPKGECKCGVTGICVGNECHSFECVRIGLKECQCPLAEENAICTTCCMNSSRSCLPAEMHSDRLIKSNLNFTLFTSISYSTAANQDVRTICNDKSCFYLNFYRFQKNSYCTYHGKVGVCIRSRCIIPFVSNRSPTLRKFDTSRSKKYSVCLKLIIILPVIYLFLQ